MAQPNAGPLPSWPPPSPPTRPGTATAGTEAVQHESPLGFQTGFMKSGESVCGGLLLQTKSKI